MTGLISKIICLHINKFSYNIQTILCHLWVSFMSFCLFQSSYCFSDTGKEISIHINYCDLVVHSDPTEHKV